MKTGKLIAGFVWLTVCVCSVTFGQGLFGYFPEDPSEILHKLLGTNCAFSATVHLAVTGGTNSFNADVRYAVLDQVVRTEFRISQIPDLFVPAGNMRRIQHCGLDQTIEVSGPDKSFLVYTNLQAWVDTTESNQSERVQFKIRKMEIAQETVNGHPCVKYDVLASGGSRYISVLVWEAKDLNRFPVRMDWTAEDFDWSVVFRDVDFNRPRAELFEIPTAYKSFNNVKELVRALCKDAVAEPSR